MFFINVSTICVSMRAYAHASVCVVCTCTCDRLTSFIIYSYNLHVINLVFLYGRSCHCHAYILNYHACLCKEVFLFIESGQPFMYNLIFINFLVYNILKVWSVFVLAAINHISKSYSCYHILYVLHKHHCALWKGISVYTVWKQV